MKIAAFLLAKDEVELTEPAIDHLRQIGVDLIIACDVSSSDGTETYLQSQRSSVFHLLHMDDLGDDKQAFFHAYGRAVTIAKEERADWILFQDADEFWLPASGYLKDCRDLHDMDMLRVDRFNVPLVRGEEAPQPPFRPGDYERLPMVTQAIPDFRGYMQENPTTPWVLGVPVPKIMVRPELVSRMKQAGHDAEPIDGVTFRRTIPGDLVTAHLPFTTKPRFARKIANIKRHVAAFDSAFGERTAWHWRRWITLAEQEGIEAEFERSIFTREELADLCRRGVVRFAAEIFADQRDRAEPATPDREPSPAAR